jgi:hypothetical protein
MPTDFIGLFAKLAAAKIRFVLVHADALRRWSFARRTPDQRLDWLEAALEIAYHSGALKPRRPDWSPQEP